MIWVAEVTVFHDSHNAAILSISDLSTIRRLQYLGVPRQDHMCVPRPRGIKANGALVGFKCQMEPVRMGKGPLLTSLLSIKVGVFVYVACLRGLCVGSCGRMILIRFVAECLDILQTAVAASHLP